MGTWGAGIFENDVALDIRDDFEQDVADGLNVYEATRKALEEWGEALDDMDNGPVIYLALAALQVECGEVYRSIREKALEIINSGQELERWRENPDLQPERRKVLEELKGKLSEE
jgi:hypothetical protein